PEQEKFVEALAYITKLYSEGLVDVDYLLNTRNTMDSKALADRVGMIFSYQATKYYNNKEFNNGTNRMQGIPYLSADGEKGMTFINDYTSRINSGVAVAVTSTCEDPKAALKWLDNLYSEEGLVVTNFGQEGVHYEIKDGKPFVDYRQMTTDEQTLTKANALAQDSTFPAIQKWDGVSSTYSVWGSEDIETWAASVDTSGILPKSVKLTVEESDAVGDLWTQLSAYADSIMNKIIIGEESIDNWPKYVEEFRGMGLDKIMAAYNAAYQRYLAR
ncbi:MAG: hypothetical protein IKV27_06220, partial [Lachnospiraceae bacterium]|nr:hypothetical protein [Lachnospiraceae bacterium]